MGKLKKKLGKLLDRVVDRFMGNGLSQEMSKVPKSHLTPGSEELEELGITRKMQDCCREAAADGAVLLKNDGTLPLRKEQRIAVFGRCQLDWFYVGYGSGGDVNAPYRLSLADALLSRGAALHRPLLTAYQNWTREPKHAVTDTVWGRWPFSRPEMPVSDELLFEARKDADTALVVIGRAAGEDRDLKLEKGSYYLSDDEESLLKRVTTAFSHTVVLLNTGGIIDLSWIPAFKEKLSSVLLLFMGGMESGDAAADLLYGDVCPSGRLTDSVALDYKDIPSSGDFGRKDYAEYTEGIFVGYRYFDRYPEKILYPFGYGLSYSSFRTETVSFREGEAVVRVTNTGKTAGKHTVLLFCRLPEGKLQKPIRVLAAFRKSSLLLPGDSEEIVLFWERKTVSSFDTERKLFVLEKGRYIFEFSGEESASPAGEIELSDEVILEKVLDTEDATRKARILSGIPEPLPRPEDADAVSFSDVLSGQRTLSEFVAGLSVSELAALTRGHGMMNSGLGIPGNAGVFGGITESLRKKGIPAISCTDGPAGLRIARYASLLPCGTLLASTFDIQLVEKLHRHLGEEMSRFGADLLLAPGMNIHRNPLCGRNFEYYSEDPLVSGKIAAAAVRGVQKSGKGCCPKHFACNHQEYNRARHDARVPEQALREIYLRNFEIVVKEARPLAIMSSYNRLNGIWAHYHYDLVTTVLRNEWGFDGAVITDWWMKPGKSPEFPLLKNNAYRVRAQVDVLMPGDMLHIAREYREDRGFLKSFGKLHGITRAELERSAMNVLRLILRLKAKES